MTVLDVEMAAEAIAMLEADGTLVTLTEPHTVTDGEDASGTPHTNVRAVVDGYRTHEIDGTLIAHGDVRLYVAGSGLGFTPAKDWTATIQGTERRVVAVTTYGQDLTILYEMQCR